MSAHAYIHWADVPDSLIATSRQHVDEVTDAKIVAFDGAPFSGQLWEGVGGLQVEYPFPRNADLRASLVNWLFYHGIHFKVVF